MDAYMAHEVGPYQITYRLIRVFHETWFPDSPTEEGIDLSNMFAHRIVHIYCPVNMTIPANFNLIEVLQTVDDNEKYIYSYLLGTNHQINHLSLNVSEKAGFILRMAM